MHVTKIISLLIALTSLALGYSRVLEGRNIGLNIVGGNSTEPHQYPSIVDIRRDYGSTSSHYCHGSIINKNWIITAAHCSTRSIFSYIIVAGEHNITAEEGTEQRRSVFEIILHQEYDGYSNKNDIALMRVSPPFFLNNVVGVVELPPKGYSVDGNTVAIGWGRLSQNGKYPDVLQHVVVPFVNDIMCQEAYYPRRIYDSMMCAGHPEGGRDRCEGDSGGPLNHKGKLVGLTLGGKGCGQKGYPGVYTEVSYYIDWINKTMSS